MDKPDHKENWLTRKPPQTANRLQQQPQPRRLAMTTDVRADVCPRCHVIHFNEESRRLCVESRHLL